MNATDFARYLALPLRAAPLLLVGIFSVLVTLAQAAGFLGLALLIVTLSWFFKYSFVLMDHVADGRVRDEECLVILRARFVVVLLNLSPQFKHMFPVGL